MSLDISRIVDGWPYDDVEVGARWIQADDGTRKLQLRLDLGVFQMEASGRPDGTCPHGQQSLLDYFLKEEAKQPDGNLPDLLDLPTCSLLQQEVMQYYYRLTAFYALKDWQGVATDSMHCLDLIDFVAEYAADDEVAWQFSQLCPYMTLMNAKAHAEIDMARRKFDEALETAQNAQEQLIEFFKENYEGYNEDGTPAATPPELDSIRELIDLIKVRKPRSEEDRIREELDRAVKLENYEQAAFLRDRLKGFQTLAPRRSAPKKRPQTEG